MRIFGFKNVSLSVFYYIVAEPSIFVGSGILYSYIPKQNWLQLQVNVKELV